VIRDAANSILDQTTVMSEAYGEAINILTELDRCQWAWREENGEKTWFRLVPDVRDDA